MGLDIDKIDFTDADHTAFRIRLTENLQALKLVLGRPGFGEGAASLGAELEIYIVDEHGDTLSINTQLLDLAQDPQLTVELNRYNLEYNLSPALISDNAFFATEQEILNKLAGLSKLAVQQGGRIVPIGILPTLVTQDVDRKSMTDRMRYQALMQQLSSRRRGRFNIDIDGRDPIQLEMDDVTLEGANTSFQVHYRVSPEDFSDMFNAIQMATPLALALSGNSPLLFGHSLWQETRIPLFKQSIDTRVAGTRHWHEPARVTFGNGWARAGAANLFAEAVNLYEPILPVCGEEDALALATAGSTPRLAELRLHQSSLWWWNRPVYDDIDGGHLRIEMRALAAGPSAIDMVANAAFLIGLAEGLRPNIDALMSGLPFHLAAYNFYRSAQYGLSSRLVWPHANQTGCKEYAVGELLAQCLPIAADGLASIGVSSAEVDRYMDVITHRLSTGQTGSVWQMQSFDQLSQKMTRDAALHKMLESYIAHSEANLPVSSWALEA
ncbi:MAG: glutamate-cysteine ligase family protein [Pseudomonadales bacterium]